MSTAYNLPVVVLNPATPAWAKKVIETMQPGMDAVYLKKLDDYYGAGTVWLQDNEFKRNNSPDPARYVPTPFTAVPPAREVQNWGKVPETGQDGLIYTMVVDPNVVPPVLPPYVKPADNTGFTTGVPSDANANQQFQVTVITMLLQMQADMVLIKKALKI